MTRGDELQNAAGKRVQGLGIRAMKEKSERLTRVAGIPIEDVCVPCYNLLQQKKLSQSYVPLRDAAKCVGCGERRVTGAYLAYCPRCAGERRVCAKCGDAHGARRPATKEQSELRALEAKLEEGCLKERERRTVLRQIERLKEKRRAEREAAREAAQREGAVGDEDEGEEGGGGGRTARASPLERGSARTPEAEALRSETALASRCSASWSRLRRRC